MCFFLLKIKVIQQQQQQKRDLPGSLDRQQKKMNYLSISQDHHQNHHWPFRHKHTNQIQNQDKQIK